MTDEQKDKDAIEQLERRVATLENMVRRLTFVATSGDRPVPAARPRPRVGLKIVLYDLSKLEALYRVGSFFALAFIALAVAYAYNRRARASAA